MASPFPDHGELGARTFILEVHPFKGMGAQLAPAAIGVVFFILPALAWLPSIDSAFKGAVVAGSVAAGVALILLSRWLVQRKQGALPSCAVYQRGVALRDPSGLHWLPVGSFQVLQRDVVMLGRSVNSIRITGGGKQHEFTGLHHSGLEELARRLQAMLRPGG